MEKTTYFKHYDMNGDGIKETIRIYKRDWTVPLFGDYRGVELARIRYIAGRRDSVKYAEKIANRIIKAIENKGRRCRHAEHHRQPDWYRLYRREMRLRTEEMVRNAGLAEKCSELLHTLAQLVAHPESEDTKALAEQAMEQAL